MRAHCGDDEFRVVFEGDVEVAEEETHERTVEDRTAQTRVVQSGDHTSWVEGQAPYGESGVTMSLDGDPQLYDPQRGARPRTTRMRSERHLEYECEGAVSEDTSGGESPSESGSGSAP
jgi:hypothetical protein